MGQAPVKVSAAQPGAAQFVPATDAIGELAVAARDCRGCELFREATQVVFGAGSTTAAMVIVGEQPGDREDRAGKPFVGPAGQLLDKALAAAGVDRERVYVTNAVKHFKFSRAAGQKRRIHQTPSRTEVVACRPWLFAELGVIEPEVVLLLGATAAKSLLGSDFRLTAHRGEVLRLPAGVRPPDVGDPQVVVSIHPSAVLRTSPQDRTAVYDGLVADLGFAAGLLSA
ncbi:MAG: UdgX family uracil-DNA binding protein [Mycobacterium sp.]